MHNVRIQAIAQGPEAEEQLAALHGQAERVLVDAPCSGTGTYRRKPDARYRITEALLAEHVEKQKMLIDRFAKLVKPGGRLIYGTCSLLREENEGVVEHFLATHPDFSVAPADAVAGRRAGRADHARRHAAALPPSPRHRRLLRRGAGAQRQVNDALQVATPERVAVDLPIAGLGSRAMAYVVDVALLGGIGLVAYFALTFFVPTRTTTALGLSSLARTLLAGRGIFFAMWIYWTLLEVLWHGQTPGKRLLRIRVVRSRWRAGDRLRERGAQPAAHRRLPAGLLPGGADHHAGRQPAPAAG